MSEQMQELSNGELAQLTKSVETRVQELLADNRQYRERWDDREALRDRLAEITTERVA